MLGVDNVVVICFCVIIERVIFLLSDYIVWEVWDDVWFESFF